MAEWCMAHPWMTVLVIYLMLVAITDIVRALRGGSN
jgi:hypothetical protein